MVNDRVVAYDFRKLRLEDFPASCAYISNQKDFEKESHTVSISGLMYVNKRINNWQDIFELSKTLSNCTRYELDQVLKLKKKSKLEADVRLCDLVNLEKSRRNLERKYYLAK